MPDAVASRRSKGTGSASTHPSAMAREYTEKPQANEQEGLMEDNELAADEARRSLQHE
ncbi:MAG TPA: hypothetical protein VGC73_15035 [Pyrinomonadaceae bacterium]